MGLEATAAVRRYVDALLARDFAAVLAAFAPDAVIDEDRGLPYCGEHRGRDGIAALLRSVGRTFDVRHLEHQVFDAGTKVVATFRVAVTARATGRSAETTVVELFTVGDEGITHLDVYYKDATAITSLCEGDTSEG